MIVCIAARDTSKRGFALYLDVAAVVLDIKYRLRCIFHAPNHHGCNLDRVSAFVVDLQPLAVEVVRSKRHLRCKRLEPHCPLGTAERQPVSWSVVASSDAF